MPGTLPRWFLGVLKWMAMYLFDLIMLIPSAIWGLLTVGGRPLDRIEAAFKSRVAG